MSAPTPLRTGDLLSLGPVRLRYLSSDHPERWSFQQLFDRTRIDSFTGCYHKPHFNEQLERAVRRAVANDGRLALAVIDIDHFKRFNDKHGHAAGDLVLQAVAARLRASADEQQGVCGRFGGEEFVLMLPERDLADAQQIAEQLRQEIAASEIEHAGQALKVTASFGVAEVGKSVDSASALFKRADAALYRAKETGRNRVCVDAEPGRSRVPG